MAKPTTPLPQAAITIAEEMCRDAGTTMEYLQQTPRSRSFAELRCAIADCLRTKFDLTWDQVGTAVGRRSYRGKRFRSATAAEPSESIRMEVPKMELSELTQKVVDLEGQLKQITNGDPLGITMAQVDVEKLIDEKLEPLRQALEAQVNEVLSWNEGIEMLKAGDKDRSNEVFEAVNVYLAQSGYELSTKQIGEIAIPQENFDTKLLMQDEPFDGSTWNDDLKKHIKLVVA